MSLCHSWFGRDLSKNLGLGAFFFGLLFGFLIRPSSERVLRTVDGLVRIRKNRLRTSLILRVPYPGFDRFKSIIFPFTFLLRPVRDALRGFGCNPASPYCLYCLAHLPTEDAATLNSSAIRDLGYPSSKYSRATFNLNSGVNDCLFRFFPLPVRLLFLLFFMGSPLSF